MKKFLKAIGCFAIFVLAVFSYFREQPYKLDSLSLQNVEALAEGEEYTHISCIGSFATWKSTKQTGSYDLQTFEIHARPTKKVEGLRPGMSVLVEIK